jgi:hypothetical protein
VQFTMATTSYLIGYHWLQNVPECDAFNTAHHIETVSYRDRIGTVSEPYRNCIATGQMTVHTCVGLIHGSTKYAGEGGGRLEDSTEAGITPSLCIGRPCQVEHVATVSARASAVTDCRSRTPESCLLEHLRLSFSGRTYSTLSWHL